MMKHSRRIVLCLLAAVMLLCAGCSKNSRVISDADYFKDYLAGYDLNRPIRFEMVFADGTVVTGEMDYYNAPVTCGNFIKLCSEGYYDGLTIHRVVPGTLIQGGDKNGDGTYRADYSIRGEFADNGWNNRLQHVRGTMSMARWSDDPNSADAQFFIMCKTYYSYDDAYAAFATITSGMGYIESLSNVPTTVKDTVPDEPIVIETISILGN
ncbi:MAG: peptidylprolyl isomerase [Clostridiaceae bacterium]|nr:peptidylprolyl isomerase [Clostridiaceae bacterium]